jgi:hypothetical protein
MNYQQRNRALFECIREHCVRTGGNPNVDCAYNAETIAGLVFNV